MPVTETITPPISPARAPAMDPQSEPDTPSPTQKPGRSRGRGKWRAPELANPGVGTRSRTKQIELDQAEATQAQASRAAWPPRPDNTDQLQRMTRELQLVDRPQDVHRDMLRILPVHKVDQNQNTHTATRHLLHPTPARCWRRVGVLYPCEHGNSRAHPSSRSISCGTAARGPSLFGRTNDAHYGVFYDAFDTHGNARTVGFPQQWEEAMRLQDEQ